MKHLGDFDASSVLYTKFTTYRPSSGTPFTLAGTPVVSIYKDGSLTQSTAGVTLTVDFDGLAGLHHLAIDTSADGTFYSAGSHFEAVITAGSVDSVSVVGSCVASFSIRKESALRPTVAGRTLDVSAGGEAGLDWSNIGSPTTAVNLSGTNIDPDQIVASVTGAVGSVTGNVGGSVASVGAGGITASSLAADAIGASELAADAVAEIAAAVWSAVTRELTSGANIALAKGTGVTGFNDLDAAGVRGAVGLAAANLDTQLSAINSKTTNLPTDPADQSLVIDATNAIMSRLGAPAGASLAADVAAVKSETAAILTDTAEIGAAGAGLTALATAANLATLTGYVDTEVAAIKATTDKLDSMTTLTSDGYVFTPAALQDAPTGGSAPSAAAIAAAVWEEPIASHSGTAGSTAEALAAAGSAGDPWATALPGSYGAGQAGFIIGTNLDAAMSSRASQASVDDLPTNAELSTALAAADDAVLARLGTPAGASIAADLASVQADTNDIQNRLPAALVSGRIDASVGAMQANTVTAAAVAADAVSEIQSGLATASALATVDGKIDTIDATADAILVDTAEIGVAGAGLTALASAASLAIVAGYVDTEVAAIKAKTDLIPASPAATGDIPTAAAIADAVHDEVIEGTTTFRQSIRLHNAALGGKVSGLDTLNPIFRDLADSKNVIDATVDGYGNRSAVTRDLT